MIENSFNSTLVRLKVRFNNPVLEEAIFQFHFGTIKSDGSSGSRNIASTFNSTLVRLKDWADVYLVKDDFAFNSTLVRLKVFAIILLFICKILSIPLWYD